VNSTARHSLPAALLPSDVAPGEELTLAGDLSELTKARLTVMVLITTLAGYCLSYRGAFEWATLLHTLLGTALVAVCSSILNQALERKTDARMSRTRTRPFVTGRLPLAATIAIGCALGAAGLAELTLFVNPLAAGLSALTLVIYAFVYTPLKRVSEINTLVGAVPGALPPLIGAAAATGHLGIEGWLLFALLACWQLPHFYAIAWMYRDDYRKAGLRMISTDDATGRRTAFHAVISASVLLVVSLLPALLGRAGWFYATVAGALSLFFLIMAVRFLGHPDRAHARSLFLTSIVYLPLVLTSLALDVAIRSW
jgi:protoheme IX farnesyltransferase